jgi:N utilization substance protein B
VKPAARRRARECAVQALYSWQLSQNDIADVEYQFLSEQDVKDVDVLYFRELLSGVATNSAYLDGLMKPYLSRLLEELGQVEKAVLRMRCLSCLNVMMCRTKLPSTKLSNWRKPSALKTATSLSTACWTKLPCDPSPQKVIRKPEFAVCGPAFSFFC